MRRLIPLAILLVGAAPAPAEPARPKRIVSLNLCADQLLLALADRSQIAALTRFATDPEMSAAATAARGLPFTRGTSEDVLALRPDLLIASPFKLSTTMTQLGGRKITGLGLDPANSLPDIVGQIRQVAAAVGHPERGEVLIARMNARLARVPRGAGRGRVAVHYQRRGFLTGTGTLVDALMTRVGLVNLAGRLRGTALSRLSLEEIALARPDYLLVERESARIVDQGTEMLHHPALDPIPRLSLPQSWTVCGGPAYVYAAESLARQLRTAPARVRNGPARAR